MRFTAFLETRLNSGMRDIGDQFCSIKRDQKEIEGGESQSEVDFNQLIILRM